MMNDADNTRILEIVTDPKSNPPFQIMCASDVTKQRTFAGVEVRINNYFQPGAWVLYSCGKIIASSKDIK